MSTYSNKEVFVLSVATLLFLVIGSFSLFLGVQWYSYRHAVWMQPRWPTAALVMENILFSSYVLIRCPLKIWLAVWILDRSLDDAKTTQQTAGIVLSNAITALYAVMWAGLWTSRVWNQYFEAQMAVKIGVAQWKQMIDSTLVTEECSWYLAKKGSWGNPRYVFKCTFIVCVFIFIGQCILGWISQAMFDITVGLLVGWVALSTVIFACKYPPFEDALFLREEARNVWPVGAVYLLLWTVAVLLPVEERNDSTAFLVYYVMRQLLNTAEIVAIQYVLSNLVIARFVHWQYAGCRGLLPLSFPFYHRRESKSEDRREHLKMLGLSLSPASNSFNRFLVASTSFSRSQSRSTDRTKPTGRKFKLADVLKSKNGFRLFMAHLFQELSYENLLCLVECIKFREKLQPEEVVVEKKAKLTKSGSASPVGGSTSPVGTPLPRSIQRIITPPIGAPPIGTSLIPLRRMSPIIISTPMDDNMPTPPSFDLKPGLIMSASDSKSPSTIIGGLVPPKTKSLRSARAKMHFPEDVMQTKSTIVSQLDTSTPTAVARLLADKYIRDSAPLCVNLSSRARFCLLEIIDGNDPSLIDYKLFDRIISQMGCLLRDSFNRFSETPQFARL